MHSQPGRHTAHHLRATHSHWVPEAIEQAVPYDSYSLDSRSGTVCEDEPGSTTKYNRPFQLSASSPSPEAPRHSQCLCRYHLHPCLHSRSALLQTSSCRDASPGIPRSTRNIDKRHTTHRARGPDQASKHARHRAGVVLPHRRIRRSRRQPHRFRAQRTGLHRPQHGADHGRPGRARGDRCNPELHGHPDRPCRPASTGEALSSNGMYAREEASLRCPICQKCSPCARVSTPQAQDKG
ncbi:hypothetical protein BD413DRAFT_549425 [Trametes elegans]|nr:hypothetical protein BD413DRAFT_549425 [Trametes elegans]